MVVIKQRFAFLLHLSAFLFCANSFYLLQKFDHSRLTAAVVILSVLHLIFPLRPARPAKGLRIALCHHGLIQLRLFWIGFVLSTVYHIALFFALPQTDRSIFYWSLLLSFGLLALTYVNGVFFVSVSSLYLGIQGRLRLLAFGWIPFANLCFLWGPMETVAEEVDNFVIRAKWKAEQPCATRYPILLVHGVFFRDSHWFNYWGRIPGALSDAGAKIYYGNHPSAMSVEKSGKWLSERIQQIVATTGCEKVNIIAHSKGGLDCRYALTYCDAAPYVASLTTVNSPHAGCAFADALLKKASEKVRLAVSGAYNKTLSKLGDEDPDFLEAVTDLTVERCALRNASYAENPLPPEIYCQSFGTVMKRGRGGVFPLNFTYHLAKYYQGANDGLVGVDSFPFGERSTLIQVKGKHGLSHADIVDLYRKNSDHFDVLDFYIRMVEELKNKGL